MFWWNVNIVLDPRQSLSLPALTHRHEPVERLELGIRNEENLAQSEVSDSNHIRESVGRLRATTTKKSLPAADREVVV